MWGPVRGAPARAPRYFAASTWIEVAAEDEDGQTWAVFHSMLLTENTAKDVYDISGAAIDLRGRVVRQRPFIGPQYGQEN